MGIVYYNKREKRREKGERSSEKGGTLSEPYAAYSRPPGLLKQARINGIQ
jgi:hypothetical protein